MINSFIMLCRLSLLCQLCPTSIKRWLCYDRLLCQYLYSSTLALVITSAFVIHATLFVHLQRDTNFSSSSYYQPVEFLPSFSDISTISKYESSWLIFCGYCDMLAVFNIFIISWYMFLWLGGVIFYRVPEPMYSVYYFAIIDGLSNNFFPTYLFLLFVFSLVS